MPLYPLLFVLINFVVMFIEVRYVMTDKQIIIEEIEINPNDWLELYKPIPACEIKDCEHWVYAGDNVYGCRIAEDGLVCDDFNNDDECCMYRQLEYYKEALKAKEQECEELKDKLNKIEEHLETISYLAPVTTRVLKHSIKTIIEE